MSQPAPQLLREIMLDILRRTPDRCFEAVRAGTTMTLDDNSLQPEKARTVVLSRIEIRPQTAQQRQYDSTDNARAKRTLEKRLDSGDQHPSQALAGFEQYVADKAIAYDHVGFTAIQPIPLDEALIVEISGLLQQQRSLLDLLIALDLFGTDIQQRDPRLLSPQRFGRHSPHDSKLEKLLGRAIDICAQVQQQAWVSLRRERCHHSRPIDTWQRSQNLARQCHQRAGVTGAYTSIGFTVANLLEGNTHGRAWLATQCLSRAFSHTNDFRRIDDFQARTIDPRMLGDKLFEKGRLADKDQMQRGAFSQTGQTGRNNAVGTEVPTHCIDRDDRSGQGLLVSALVDHLATTVETVRGHVVTQVNFTGALFHGQSVRLESVMGTTHVTGGTGFFVLLNSHLDQLLNVWVTL